MIRRKNKKGKRKNGQKSDGIGDAVFSSSENIGERLIETRNVWKKAGVAIVRTAPGEQI